MRRADWEDRVFGSLAGACVGDAMGAPTEQMSIAQIRARWGRVESLVEPPPDAPFAAGRRAGQITDDAAGGSAVPAGWVRQVEHGRGPDHGQGPHAWWGPASASVGSSHASVPASRFSSMQ